QHLAEHSHRAWTESHVSRDYAARRDHALDGDPRRYRCDGTRDRQRSPAAYHAVIPLTVSGSQIAHRIARRSVHSRGERGIAINTHTKNPPEGRESTQLGLAS